MVLVCVSLMINDTDHLFMSTVCMPSLEKCLFSFCPFFNGVVFVLMLSCMNCLCILDINSVLVISFANIFLCSIAFLFVLLMVSFAVQKLLHLIRSHLFLLLFPLP